MAKETNGPIGETKGPADETDAPEKIEIFDGEIEALRGLFSVAGLVPPTPQATRLIAEATEVFLRAKLRRLRNPKAHRLEFDGRPEAETELIVPLYGDADEQQSLVEAILSLIEGGDGGIETVAVAAKITEEAIKIAIEYAMGPELIEQLIRAAIRFGQNPFTESGHVPRCSAAYPADAIGNCPICGIPIASHESEGEGFKA